MFILLLENTVDGKLKVTHVFFKEIIYIREVIKRRKRPGIQRLFVHEIFCVKPPDGCLVVICSSRREQRRRLVCFALAPMKRSSGGEKCNSRPPSGQQKNSRDCDTITMLADTLHSRSATLLFIALDTLVLKINKLTAKSPHSNSFPLTMF